MNRLELISSPEYVKVMFESSFLNYKTDKERNAHLLKRMLELQKELIELLTSSNELRELRLEKINQLNGKQ